MRSSTGTMWRCASFGEGVIRIHLRGCDDAEECFTVVPLPIDSVETCPWPWQRSSRMHRLPDETGASTWSMPFMAVPIVASPLSPERGQWHAVECVSDDAEALE